MNITAWKKLIAEQGCVVCSHFDLGVTPANLHHIREGQGMSQRSSDWLVVPLCKEHHQGQAGIHSGQFYQRFKLDEMDLLAMTISRAMVSRR